MTRYDDDDGRERPSWREIDRRKDRPYAPKEAPRERKPSQRSNWMRQQYRKEADKLFLGKKGTKEYQKAVAEMEKHQGTERFDAAARAFLEAYGLPDDWGTLSLLLDYSEPDQVSQALKVMKEFYPKKTAVEQQGFRARLQILGMTSPDSDLRDLTEEILRTL